MSTKFENKNKKDPKGIYISFRVNYRIIIGLCFRELSFDHVTFRVVLGVMSIVV